MILVAVREPAETNWWLHSTSGTGGCKSGEFTFPKWKLDFSTAFAKQSSKPLEIAEEKPWFELKI